MKSTHGMPRSPFWIGFNSAGDLRALRNIAGLTQAALASLAGVHRQTVVYHESRDGRIDGVAPERFRKVIEAKGHSVPRYGQPAVALPPAPPKTMCGAHTPDGPCKSQPGKSGRCRLHGDLSTGPKSAEGRERIAEAQRQRHAKKRSERVIANGAFLGAVKDAREPSKSGHAPSSTNGNLPNDFEKLTGGGNG